MRQFLHHVVNSYCSFPPPSSAASLVVPVRYAAPEVIVDHEARHALCDIFSLGLVAFELWTGERPYERIYGADINERVAAPDVVPDLPPPLAEAPIGAIIRQCWEALESRPTAGLLHQHITSAFPTSSSSSSSSTSA